MPRGKNKEMKAYMIYSIAAGAEEGAALVFAMTQQEAKVYGFRMVDLAITSEYMDVGCTCLWNKPWLFKYADPEKIKNKETHGTMDVECCKRCELWGGSPLSKEGICQDCILEENLEGKGT